MEMQKSASQYRNDHSFVFTALAIALLIIITYISQILPESLQVYTIPAILVIITAFILIVAYQFRKLQNRNLITEHTTQSH